MSEVSGVRDQDAVIDAVNRLFLAVDEKDWAGARACLADRVHVDMTSLGAAEAAEMAAEELVGAWRNGLAAMEAVHHHSGNFRVEIAGESATCFCYATAYHHRRVRSGRNLRMFVGSYDYRLVRDSGRWRITQFKFNAKFVDGNLELDTEPPA